MAEVMEKRKVLTESEYEEREIQRIHELGLDFDKQIPNSREQYFNAKKAGFVTFSTIFLSRIP